MTARKSRKRPGTDLFGSLAAVLFATAVVKELRRPAHERTWHGEVLGFVPYDLRLPTWDRIRASWWAPDSPRLLLPRAFGVGWSVNLARVRALVAREPGGRATGPSAHV